MDISQNVGDRQVKSQLPQEENLIKRWWPLSHSDSHRLFLSAQNLLGRSKQ